VDGCRERGTANVLTHLFADRMVWSGIAFARVRLCEPPLLVDRCRERGESGV
jgi:hypothetical protein